jgi:hypothetical protein
MCVAYAIAASLVCMTKREPPNLAQVRDTLKPRLAYIEGQISDLQKEADEIRSILGGSPASTGSAARLSGPALRASILRAVQKEPGLSGASYATTVKTTGQTALGHLNALEEAGEVRREGQKRSTRWFPA